MVALPSLPAVQPAARMQNPSGVGLEQSDTPGEPVPAAQPSRLGEVALVPLVLTWLMIEGAVECALGVVHRLHIGRADLGGALA